MALENLDPAVRIEEILDGQDIEPATRLEYFLKKAAEGGGSGGSAIHVVRATGNIVVTEDGSDYYIDMDSDTTAETIGGWLNAGEPVFCLAPTVDRTGYHYINASMELIRKIVDTDMTPNSGARSLYFSPSDGIFEWYFEGSN